MAICGVGESARGKRIGEEGVGGERVFEGKNWSSCRRGFREGLRGEETDCLGHGGLEGCSVGGVCAAMGGKNLSVAEEGREQSARSNWISI